MLMETTHIKKTKVKENKFSIIRQNKKIGDSLLMQLHSVRGSGCIVNGFCFKERNNMQ
jgi:hypothetical protein